MTDAFHPDWVSPPGDTIVDLLQEKHRSVYDLARELGWSPEQLANLLDGTTVIDEALAGKLEIILGSTRTFWLNRERLYRESLKSIEGQHAQS